MFRSSTSVIEYCFILDVVSSFSSEPSSASSGAVSVLFGAVSLLFGAVFLLLYSSSLSESDSSK
jgi:hypothetical protein